MAVVTRTVNDDEVSIIIEFVCGTDEVRCVECVDSGPNDVPTLSIEVVKNEYVRAFGCVNKQFKRLVSERMEAVVSKVTADMQSASLSKPRRATSPTFANISVSMSPFAAAAFSRAVLARLDSSEAMLFFVTIANR